MKAWIEVFVKSENPAILSTIETVLPARLDSRLWDTAQYTLARGTDPIYGFEYVYASLFFNDFNERASFKAALGGINGFLKSPFSSGYIRGTKCWHDELDEKGSPIKSDEEDFMEVIT